MVERIHPITEPLTPTSLPRRIESNAKSVKHDLMKLVLTIMELVRQLMKAQALRQVNEGDLNDLQVEKLNTTLMRLKNAMKQLKNQYDLSAANLNLNLKPLKPLLRE